MNSDLYRKLFQAISVLNDENIRKVAWSIIDDERKKGHDLLARQLDSILSSNNNLNASNSTINTIESKKKHSSANNEMIPLSRRDQEPLGILVSPERLRHYMVLDERTEVRIQRIENEYAARYRLAKYGLVPRNKVLLYGPPGCGKSLGVERIAWNLGLPLLKVRFDTLVSSYFGETAMNLRKLFDTASNYPCVLFIDECDFITQSRSEKNDVGEMPRIVNSLLQFLDDCHPMGLIIAATNLKSRLDEAIFRRFDDVLEIPMPGYYEIRKLLDMTFDSVEIDIIADKDVIVGELKGLSASQVVKVAQDSAKMAILLNDLPVSTHHVLTAIRELGVA